MVAMLGIAATFGIVARLNVEVVHHRPMAAAEPASQWHFEHFGLLGFMVSGQIFLPAAAFEILFEIDRLDHVVVMDCCLLEIPVRQGSQVPLETALLEYISKNFGQTSALSVADCQQLATARSDALKAVSKGPVDPLLKYFGMVRNISNKFPGDVAPFAWSSTLGHSNKQLIAQTLWFDAVNVLYNCGARYTQVKTDYKAGYQNFQLAAGVYDLLAATPLDMVGLDAATFKFLRELCLAQSQECFWAAQRDQKSSLLAKLAAGVADAYQRAETLTRQVPQLKAEWCDDIATKKSLFTAIAQYRQSMACLETQKYGEQVARLQQAKALLSAPLGKYVSSALSTKVGVLLSRVESDCRNAEKENDLLYLQEIPSRPALPQPMASSKIKVPEIEAPTLFTLLLPFAVYHAPEAYSQRLHKYVKDFIIDELERLNQQKTDVFAEYMLPASLEFITAPDIIPKALIRESEKIKSRGGVDSIQSFLDENKKLQVQALNRLAVLPDSSEKSGLLAYISTASNSDEMLQDKINSSRYLIGILNQGYAAIEVFVPTGHSNISQGLKLASENVLTFVQQLESLASKRQDKITYLMAKLRGIDLSTPIHEFITTSQVPITDPSQLEPVYNAKVAQFDQDVRSVDQSKAQQQRLIDELQEKMSVFGQKKLESAADSSAREEAIDSLQTAAHQYQSISANLKDGRDFYNALLSKISELERSPPEPECADESMQTDPELEPQHVTAYAPEHEPEPVSVPEAEPEPAPAPTPAPAPSQNNVWKPGMGVRFG